MNVVTGERPSWFPLPEAWRAYAIATAGSVLLETAGGLGNDHTSYLFTSPEKILCATSTSELTALLKDIEAATREGFYAAGSIDYEATYALHEIPAEVPRQPIARFGIYREPLRFDHHSGSVSGVVMSSVDTEAIRGTAILSTAKPRMERSTYAEKFSAIQRFLIAGDTYQVNLTTHVDAHLLGSPLALYTSLIDAQPVDFAAILNFGDRLLFSLSPELFFHMASSRIVTRPMKGTAPRGRTAEEDTHQCEWLAKDEKNRAEHVMIVDLLRNDLGRICHAGLVRADNLFCVEAYPTLFQMTSTVSGTLQPATRIDDVIRALFPSGSVTGAPKRRTMEIIRDLEDGPRGIYTGAIGFVSPDGSASFSVPIRTLEVCGEHVSMGVGGGIVADSAAAAEYDECLLKASFLQQAAMAPRLIETLLWNRGYPLLELHLARLSKSAAQLGFQCDVAGIRNALTTAATKFYEETRVRLLLSADGKLEIGSAPVIGRRTNLRVRLAARRILSSDPWLQHKTTRRALYEREFSRARLDSFDEVLFLNERGELAEGAISTLFVERNGQLYTPPLSCGALPGVLRQHLFETHPAISEKILRMEDLFTASSVYVGNALRGLRTVGSLHIE